MNILCFFGFHKFEARHTNTHKTLVYAKNGASVILEDVSFVVPGEKYIGDSCARCFAMKMLNYESRSIGELTYERTRS